MPETCEQCARQGLYKPITGQRFDLSIPGLKVAFDIERAKARIQARLADYQKYGLRELSLEELEIVCGVNQSYDTHLTHIPASAVDEPGIAVFMAAHPNQPPALYIIDGSHRAQLARQHRRTFKCYVLLSEDAQAALIK